MFINIIVITVSIIEKENNATELDAKNKRKCRKGLFYN